MIKFVIQNLQKLGFADEQIYTTIENKMKCGVGKCGRCNVGKDYVCVKRSSLFLGATQEPAARILRRKGGSPAPLGNEWRKRVSRNLPAVFRWRA